MKTWDDDNKKLLAALDSNAKSSYAELARSTDLNQQKARYRVQHLEEAGLFAACSVSLPLTELGFLLYKLHFRVGGATPDELDHLVSYLVELPQVIWVAQYDGQFNLAVVLRVSSASAVGQFLRNFYIKFGKYIYSKQLTVNLSSEYLSRSYILEGKEEKKTLVSKSAVKGDYKLDLVDCIILEHLGRDCRKSAKEVAEAISSNKKYGKSFTPEGVLHRIKKLEQEGVIIGYKLYLNPLVSNRLHYNVLFWFDYSKSNTAEDFDRFCRSLPEAVYFSHCVGDWDCELSLEVDDVSSYREIMTKITKQFASMIRDYTSLMTTEFAKINLADGLVDALEAA